jgi:hypothetical protein
MNTVRNEKYVNGSGNSVSAASHNAVSNSSTAKSETLMRFMDHLRCNFVCSPTTKLTGKIKMQSEAAQLYFVRVQRLVMPCPSLQSQP